MPSDANPIVDTYSQLADAYDDDKNISSCWGRAAQSATHSISLHTRYRVVADIGCGTGKAIAQLAASAGPETRFIGVEPAANMCKKAKQANAEHSNVEIIDGSFENIPIDTGSVDYTFSIMAFHWTTDIDRSIAELSRILDARGEMDLFFIGRNNGREFIKKTSPLFLKYMGPARFLQSAKMRKQLTLEEAQERFSREFGDRITVTEDYKTYFDTLEGHWGWWVRIEGQFINLPEDQRAACYGYVKTALSELDTPQGIPYTLHELHVRLR